MKNLILIFLFIPLAFSQPRPTGNVLTEEEKIRVRKDLIEREEVLLKNLHQHVQGCYNSLTKPRNLPDLVSTYRYITTVKGSGVECKPAELECLQNVPKDLTGQGAVLIKSSHYKDFLMKEHKLKESEAQDVIDMLREILKIPKQQKDEAQPLYNKS